MIDSSEIHESVDDFEAEHEEMLALIEKHKDEAGFTEGVLALCGVARSEYDEYLSKKEASDELPQYTPLVPDADWSGYVQELLEDAGEVKVPHYVVIDWDATAENIQQDYSSIEINGVTYWWRE